VARIVLEHVSKRFGDEVEAVRDVSLEIADGEFMVLVGPSGCGKSTILRILAGLEEVTQGRVLIGERDVTNLAPKERDVAMVFQSYALYPHMTVRDNLGFGLRIRRTDRAEIAERVTSVARILGLEPLLDRRPAELSGGQRQRVAMGRAIVRRPQAFLMDEPLSNLDAKLRVQMRAELARLHGRLGTTTVYVTHDQTEAMTLGHRVAVLRDGTLQQVDAPQELYARPRNLFVAGFIGSPPMNLLRGRVRGRFLELGTHRLPLGSRAELPDQTEVVVGIRPEHLRPANASDDHALVAPVEVVEELGSEVLVFARLDVEPARTEGGAELLAGGGALVCARLPAGSRFRPGTTIRLALDPAELRFFDPASEEAIPLRAAALGR
jgi:multiple sugar transport system ATP-binding protein